MPSDETCEVCGYGIHFVNEHATECSWWRGDAYINEEDCLSTCPVRVYMVCPALTGGRYVTPEQWAKEQDHAE
jgi:hypothetical protein